MLMKLILLTFLSIASVSPQSWNEPKFDKLLDSCFETGFEMSYLYSSGSKQTVTGFVVFDHGKFLAQSSDYQFVYDGKALYIIYEESKEVLIDKYDGIDAVLGAIIGQASSVIPAFSGDKLTSLKIETENGTAVSVTVPSFRYLSKPEDSSYLNRFVGSKIEKSKTNGGQSAGNLIVVDCASLEAKGYVVTDLR